ncbi:MAG: hypothetical protein IKZ61_08860 [Prevotella sp.]|nr:hypothetical protein [Prevotella sp.]
MIARLKILFWSAVAVSLIMVLLFETDILLAGALADDVSGQFVVVTITELLTICAIPLAVRLFRFRKIRSEIRDGHYAKWAFLRLSILALLLVCNTLLYYVYMNVAFGYMAIIVLISMVFVYPTESRMKSETATEE